ncbi:hypothetical protein [Phaeovulum vinaykumarii]|uniref:Uncharacterized protein n=1 Tax=Phaeovulum vinaykumarii TaxID=407234 RepID=A0A1N7M528_9RHOB|nr:hypothetical protein [Phaeovulum vinaykumarii]SIS81142.1 hypothetical protein SAMN05421795_105199 [Phaeovulum vinaykumarii]SOC08647.1 hypothetical protein SAMN05878426_1053 [Phaeovulum vinaykumarii]
MNAPNPQPAPAKEAILPEIMRAVQELAEARRFVDLVFYASCGCMSERDPKGEAMAAGCERALLSLDEMAVYLDNVRELLKGGAQ